jgi:U3 small nucleolar RNA-associated protein 11
MLSAHKTEAGKHGRGDTQANRLDHDAVKLLKSQDTGYLRVVAGRGRREITKLEEQVGMEKVQGNGKKVVFMDEDSRSDGINFRTMKQRRTKNETVEESRTGNRHDHSDPEPENIEPTINISLDPDEIEAAVLVSTASKSKKALAAERDALRDLRAARKRRKRLGELRVAKLEALKKRQREIMAAADELELQRAKMARTVGGVNKDGVKWKIRERKR